MEKEMDHEMEAGYGGVYSRLQGVLVTPNDRMRVV